MARTDDKNKPTAEEEAALKNLYEQSKSKQGDRYLTLTKDDRTAKYILKKRMKERGEAPVTHGDIEARAGREDKYGRADWTPPDLTKPLPKLSSTALWDAIERFVQLPDSGLEDFRSKYPAFLPQWFYSIPADSYEKPGLLAWQAWRNLLREAWHTSFHPEYAALLVNIPAVPPGNAPFEVQPVGSGSTVRVCDAQRAVLGMTLESWRARFCPKCGLPFVARKAADKYWPKQCFAEQRREKQRASKRKRARKRAKSLRRTKR
jgi:hypothetical protein